MRYSQEDAREAFFDASSRDDVAPWAIDRFDEPAPIDLASLAVAPRDERGEHPTTLF